jgi:hypothetical protein
VTPLRELADALRRGEIPGVAWALRVAPDGSDPVERAWRESEDARAMAVTLHVLELARPVFALPYCPRLDQFAPHYYADCVDCADQIRAAVPRLTTADVTAALAARGETR